MYLHEDKEVFIATIMDASKLWKLPITIVEKDYYVTMILKLLAVQLDNCVFKGGTSLSKGYHLLNRFSEDIDITFTEHIGEARRKKLKHIVLKGISDTLHMPILNWDNIQSDRDYNQYIFGYQSIAKDGQGKLYPGVKLETALASYAFPTEKREIDSYVRQLLQEKKCNAC